MADSEQSVHSVMESESEDESNVKNLLRCRATTMDQNRAANRGERYRLRRHTGSFQVSSTSRIGADGTINRGLEFHQSSESLLLRTMRVFARAQRELEAAVGRVSDEERALAAASTGAGHNEWPTGSAIILKQKGSRLQRAKSLMQNAASRFDDVERTLKAAAGVLSDEDSDDASGEHDDSGRCRSRRRQRKRASITIDYDEEDRNGISQIQSAELFTQSSNSIPISTTSRRRSLNAESSPQKRELFSEIEAEEKIENPKSEIEVELTTASTFSESELAEEESGCEQNRNCGHLWVHKQSENQRRGSTIGTGAFESKRSLQKAAERRMSANGFSLFDGYEYTEATQSSTGCSSLNPLPNWPQRRGSAQSDPLPPTPQFPHRTPVDGSSSEAAADEASQNLKPFREHTFRLSASAFEQQLLARLLGSSRGV